MEMANFREVNKAIKKLHPTEKLEVVRGEGYFYIVPEGDYADWPQSIYSNPTTTSTQDAIRLAEESIRDWL
jgi:hypothetical protein